MALYTLAPAASGGRSILASSFRVYDELAAQHPDHIRTLSTPDWAFDRYHISYPALHPAQQACDLLLPVPRPSLHLSPTALSPAPSLRPRPAPALC